MDDMVPEQLKRIALQIQMLILCGDPYVADSLFR